MYWALLKLFWGFIFSHLIWRNICYFLCIFFTLDRIIASWMWFYKRTGCCNERYKKWLLVMHHKVRNGKEMTDRGQTDKINFVDLNRQLPALPHRVFLCKGQDFLISHYKPVCKFFFFFFFSIIFLLFINFSSFLPWHPFLLCCRSDIALSILFLLNCSGCALM